MRYSHLIIMEEGGRMTLQWVEQCVTKSVINSKVYGMYVPSPRQVSAFSIRGANASASEIQE